MPNHPSQKSLACLLALLLTSCTLPTAGDPDTITDQLAPLDTDLQQIPAPDDELPDDLDLPGITIDRDAGHVDIDAEVVLRDADWLELIVCSPNTREHESILTSPARPSHIHFALLMIGLQPGNPMVWERRGDEFHTEPPRGQPVALYYILEPDDDDDQDAEKEIIPANRWVYHEQEQRALRNNLWLFTGSAIETFEDQQLYMADLNGTIVSLVNFGDDLLARPTDLTNFTDQQQFNTYTERIPEKGTQLKLRIQPVEPDHDAPLPDQQDFDPPKPN